jgi:chromosome segregation protein
MRLKSIELNGFKSFAKKTQLDFASAITAIVGPNGSGKSNTAEAFRFALGEQSMKSLRGRRGEDLLWNGSSALPRAGRASVRLVFDNSDRVLPLDFNEVAIERVVNRDGVNEYLLNDSPARLRDVTELLAAANIGASGHHIISQGEADRILSASSRERRQMLEDALGLTAYLYKRREAQRKLLKTAENMREVEALRRELLPHLRFLQGQMKKLEDTQKVRDEFTTRAFEYFKRESIYVRINKALLTEERAEPMGERERLAAHITELRTQLAVKHDDGSANELMRLETESRAAATRREELTRQLGRIEGALTAREHVPTVEGQAVPAREAQAFAEQVKQGLEQVLASPGGDLQSRLEILLSFAKEFLKRLSGTTVSEHTTSENLEEKKSNTEAALNEARSQEDHTSQAIRVLRKKIEGEKDASRDAERELFTAMARRSDLEASLAALNARGDTLARDEDRFKADLGEAAILIGHTLTNYEAHELRLSGGEPVSDADILDESRSIQEDRHRKLERLKARLEEAGAGSGAEIVAEHRETSERDQFLARELTDLEQSTASLNELIVQLSSTLEAHFIDGVAAVNKQFDTFFKMMFDGGTASLAIIAETKVRKSLIAPDPEDIEEIETEEDEETEEGIEITVALPHKRLKGLHMLSGGERALTSIALIFALSQVNPPPFLILDETDAALDEANSRRYGDMIETLGKRSQLILITHNRETMSRAGVLYGITMGSDGASKLLSVKFEEALAVAK